MGHSTRQFALLTLGHFSPTLLLGLPHVLHVVLSTPFATRRHPPREEIWFGRYRASTNKLGSPFSHPVRPQANPDLSQFLMGLYPNSGLRLGANSEERSSLVLTGQCYPLALGTLTALFCLTSGANGSPRPWQNVRLCRALPVTSTSVAATTATHILPPPFLFPIKKIVITECGSRE